ncbi:hypothetical protein FNYG_13564 [Fusarium nygamai]|uniref:Uncharacterized protein n=1 Tax=Gibberella nygamai TaxID=42673 RepID=A0A2K0UV89_GIBNY|nr:hypothetical protein FNYG_13564 [Fusarium nygamai]
MAVGKHAQGTKRDRSNENSKKKWSTLRKNGLNIHQIYDAEVYVCIRRRGEKYEFKSTEKALPLSDEEKNESFPPPVLEGGIRGKGVFRAHEGPHFIGL